MPLNLFLPIISEKRAYICQIGCQYQAQVTSSGRLNLYFAVRLFWWNLAFRFVLCFNKWYRINLCMVVQPTAITIEVMVHLVDVTRFSQLKDFNIWFQIRQHITRWLLVFVFFYSADINLRDIRGLSVKFADTANKSRNMYPRLKKFCINKYQLSSTNYT